jgi:SAM-dependent methyltransferase
MLSVIKDFLIHPKIKNLDVNSSRIVEISREIIHSKRMFKEVISELYAKCYNLDKKYFSQQGSKLEIGAGVSFIKDLYPEVITSDIKSTPHLDMEVDALNMSFDDESLGAIYGLNCFHHLPNPDMFFNELKRVLVKKGGCVIIDPYHGPLASFLYKRLFSDETFDKKQTNWEDPNNEIMKGANQALSYIVFKRDAHILEQKHPELEVILQKPFNNYLRYLISGGLNFKALLPNFMIPVLKFIEFILTPINHLFALHQVIVIRKK